MSTEDNMDGGELIFAPDASIIPICALFRYTEEEILTRNFAGSSANWEIKKETEELLLQGIDLSMYGYYDPSTQKITPFTPETLREPSGIKISNELTLLILENAAANLAGGYKAIYNTGKKIIELVPSLRQKLLFCKVFPPRQFFRIIGRIFEQMALETVRMDFCGRNSMKITLNFPLVKKSPTPTKARCSGFLGALEAIMDFTEIKCKRIVETCCIADGDDYCEILMEWKTPNPVSRIKNFIRYVMFRDMSMSFQQAAAEKDHEIFIATANLRAEQKKLQTALAELEYANKKLAKLNELDGLTGIKNRLYFEGELERLFRSMSRFPERNISLILMDIDRFKDLNDTYGHQTGDRVLKSVAAVLAGCARRSDDFCARYGGEEFAIVLPHTSASDAALLAEEARSLVEESLECRPEPLRSVTISGGVSSISVGNEDCRNSINRLIAEADSRLYESKRAGRNRITYLP